MLKLLNDFSPILVKDFRQGIRSRMFTSSFLILQVMIVMAVIFNFSVSGSATRQQDMIFWVLLSIPLFLMLPLSGMGAISEERKLQTLELLYLSRLTSFKIIFGKWLSICCQMILLVSTVLPCVVVRYYIGGVNFWNDLLFLAWMLFIAIVYASLCVSVSAIRMHVSFRWAIVGLVGWLLFLLGFGSLLYSHYGGGFFSIGSRAASTGFYALFVIYGFLVALLLIEIASLEISPEAENHAIRIRAIGVSFVMMMIMALLILKNEQGMMIAIFSFFGVMATCLVSLFEGIRDLPTVYTPFVKRGIFGRLLGWVAYPGWFSGSIYTFFACIAVLAIPLVFLPSIGLTTREEVWKDYMKIKWIFLAILSSVYFSAAILKLFGDRIRRYGTFSLAFYMLSSLPFFIYWIGHRFNRDWESWMEISSALTPISYLFYMMYKNNRNIDLAIQMTGNSVCVFVLILFIWNMIKARGEIRMNEIEAQEFLDQKR